MASDCYAILDNEQNVYISRPVTAVIRNAPTLEAAINALLKAAPPDTVKGVFIFNDPGFENCRRPVEAVQKAGYTDVEMVEAHAFLYSSIIDNVPLKQSVGTVVFVSIGLKTLLFERQVVTVLQKWKKGWKVVKENQKYAEALTEFSSVSDVIVHEGTPSDITELQQYFPGRSLHVNEAQPGYITRFVQNVIMNGNLDEYVVLPFCSYDLMVQFGDKSEKILLDDVPPFTITKKIDVGDASTVEIYVCDPDQVDVPLIKTFKFKSAAFRNVSITVNVDKTLLPQVTLKTIATRGSDATTVSQHDLTPSIIIFVTYSSSSVIIVTLDQKQVTDETTFPNFNDGVAFMLKKAPDASTAIVVIQYVDTATVVQLQTVRSECRKAGFLNVKLVSYNSMALSLLLGSLQSPIDNGTLIAILNPKVYYIVTRDGRNFKVLKGEPLNQFDVDRCDARKVVISNANGCFGKAMLKAVQQKFRSNVHIVTDVAILDDLLHQFLWNYIDETAVNTDAFNNFCDFDISIMGHKVIPIRFKEFPISVTIDIAVSHLTTLEVSLVKSETKDFLKKFTLRRGTKYVRMMILADSAFDVTTTMEVLGKADVHETVILCGSMVAAEKSDAVTVEPTVPTKQLVEKTTDTSLSLTPNHGTVKIKKSRSERRKQARRNALQNGTADEPPKATEIPKFSDDKVESTTSLPNELSQLQLDPPPTIILTFTSDNRVLIKADETYTGVKEVLAYVRLQAGKAPIVGQQAFDALKTHPESVFYGITRLLATDFDPAHPDLTWTFKTSRGADGKVLIHGGDDIVTLPIVLFGLVANSTLLYIKEYQKAEVTELGIRFPTGSTISDADLKAVSAKIGVKLVVVEDK